MGSFEQIASSIHYRGGITHPVHHPYHRPEVPNILSTHPQKFPVL